MKSTLTKKSFFGVSLGTLIEYYDCILFSIFLPIISPLFFPGMNAYEALMKGYLVYSISIILRPFGGVLFGYLGDKLGRRKALLMSMYGIALSTIIIGITPSYANWGIATIIIIMIAKSTQIFCFGGEYNGAGIYVVEHALGEREGLVGGCLSAMTLFGALLATLMGVLCTASFMPSWSWRLAFVIGGLIGILGILSRKNLPESPYFLPAKDDEHKLTHLIKKYPKELLTGVFIGGFITIPFTTVLTFINPVFMTKGWMTSQQFMWLQAGIMAVAIITLICAGYVADKKSPVTVMRYAAICLVLFSYPLLMLMDKGGWGLLIVTQLVLIIINEMLLGPSNAYFKNLFPMQYRYRASSLSFGIGMSLMGGLTPLIDGYLYKATEHLSSISLWLVLVGIGTYGMLKLCDKKHVSAERNLEFVNHV